MGIQIAARLLRGYLALPYSVHLNRDSAQMTRNVFDAVQRLVNEVLEASSKGSPTRVAIARALYRVHEEGRVTDGGRFEEMAAPAVTLGSGRSDRGDVAG